MSQLTPLSDAKDMKEQANAAYKTGLGDDKRKALIFYQLICDATLSPPDLALQRVCRNNMALCHFDLAQIQESLEAAREVIKTSPSSPSDTDKSQTTKAIYRAAKALNSLNDYSEALSLLESITGPPLNGVLELKKRIHLMQQLHPKPVLGPGQVLFLYRAKCPDSDANHTYDFQVSVDPTTLHLGNNFSTLLRPLLAILDPLLESDSSIMCSVCERRRACSHRHSPMVYMNTMCIIDMINGVCSAVCDQEVEATMLGMGATAGMKWH